MNTFPTATNGGLLAYLLAALVLVAMAALSRPRRGVALGTPGPHKFNPSSAEILADEDAAGAVTTTSKKKEAAMPNSNLHSIRIFQPDYDGRAPLLPADTPEYLLDAAPWWAAQVITQPSRTPAADFAAYSSDRQGAVGKGITTRLSQSFEIDTATGEILNRDEPSIELTHPDCGWIDIDASNLDEVKRALLLAEAYLTSVDCTPHGTDEEAQA